MKWISVLVGFCGLCTAAASHAQMKEMPPGLWEMQRKVEMPGMTPEMAAKMGNRATTYCVKPGERKWNEQRHPAEKSERKCEQTELKVDGNKVQWKVECADGTGGDGVLVHNGKDSYTQTMNMRSKRGTMKITMEGKRIADSCEKK